MIKRDTYRSLTISLGFWSLISSTFTALLFNRLPDDPLHIGRHIATYNAFASVLALLGIVGAKKRNAVLTTIFGNYLYLDILICTLPRLITMTIFPAFRAQICPVDSMYAWPQSQRALAERGVRTEDLLKQCDEVVVVLQMALVLGVLAATAVQVMLAVRVGRFARALREEGGVVLVEKRHLEDTSKTRALEVERLAEKV